MVTGRGPRSGQTELARVCMDRLTRAAGSGMSGHHCHAYYELYYLEQGSCSFLLDDSECRLGGGDLLLIPPQTFHCSRYPQERTLRCIVYFRAEDIGGRVAAFLPEGSAFFGSARLCRIPGGQRGAFEELFARMAAEEQSCDAQTGAMQQLFLQALLLLIARHCLFLPPPPSADLHTADRQTLQAARFIRANYMNPVSSADIAAAAGFSPNHLSRRFRENAGMGVHEYLTSVRLQHAALELVSTDDSVTQIALRCGFSDSNYFKDVFKQKYGMTPREYRKSR